MHGVDDLGKCMYVPRKLVCLKYPVPELRDPFSSSRPREGEGVGQGLAGAPEMPF